MATETIRVPLANDINSSTGLWRLPLPDVSGIHLSPSSLDSTKASYITVESKNASIRSWFAWVAYSRQELSESFGEFRPHCDNVKLFVEAMAVGDHN